MSCLSYPLSKISSDSNNSNVMTAQSWSSTRGTMSVSTRSPSIPIAQSEEYIREEYEQFEAARTADYRDLAFCTRLVDGMRKQQKHQENLTFVYQNQVVIDHIIDTRRGIRDSNEPTAVMPPPPPMLVPHSPMVGHHMKKDSFGQDTTYIMEDLLQDVMVMVQHDDVMFEMDL